MEDENTVPTVATTEINKEFLKKVPKLTPANPFHPLVELSNVDFSGINCHAVVKIEFVSLKELIIIQTSG